MVPELLGVAPEVHHDHPPPPYGVSFSTPTTWAGLAFAQAVSPAVNTLSVPVRATLLKPEPSPNQVLLRNPGTFTAHLTSLW